MKNLIIFIAISLVALSCKSNPIDSNGGQSIVGEWVWIQSSGGYAGNTIRPAANTKFVLRFTSDSSYAEIRNDTVLLTSRYSIHLGQTIFQSDLMPVISFQNSSIPMKVIFKLSNDSLHLADNHYDGYGSLYIRANR